MKRLRRLLAITGILAVLAIAGVGGWAYSLYRTPTVNTEQTVVNIPRGYSFRQTVETLSDAGVYPHPDFLYLWGRVSGQTAVRAGEYAIAPGLSVDALLALLRSGESVQYRVTFVEGSTFSEWRRILGDLDTVTQTLPELTDADVASALGLAQDHPEGWLFPSTYFFQRGTTDLALLERAHEQMRIRLDEAWASRSERTAANTPYEALILASLIERETGAAWERGEIAGVFTRRLERGMRLQTDPTIIYGLGDDYDGTLSRRDLENWTPYNTYQIDGLPPTPIAMPGEGAIEAALNPEPGDTLYFVARGDGTHVFSRTLREHNAAVREYQLRRREDYRSSPPPAPDAEQSP